MIKKSSTQRQESITLDSTQLRQIRGGDGTVVSNVLKTRHDTVKNT